MLAGPSTTPGTPVRRRAPHSTQPNWLPDRCSSNRSKGQGVSDWEPMLEAMLARRYSALKGYAVILCGDPAEADDLVQDAIVATFGAARRFDNVGTAEAYVRRAIASRFIDERRRERSRRAALRVVGTGEGTIAAGPALLAEHATDVQRALQELPPRQRVCVVLRFLDHLSTRETAQALGISEGAVKRYVSDAMARLAPLLDVPTESEDPEWIETKVTR